MINARVRAGRRRRRRRRRRPADASVVFASGGDELFNLSRYELERGERDRRGGGGADEVGAASAIESGDAAFEVNSTHEGADAAKRTETVHVHVRTDHLVWVRQRRRDHLCDGAGNHEIYGLDLIHRHLALSRELNFDGFVERKLNYDVRDANQRRAKAAVQPFHALFAHHSRQSVYRGRVRHALGHRRRQRVRVLHLQTRLRHPQRIGHENRRRARPGGG